VAGPPDPELEALLARLEPPYRSRGEAQVGRLLDRYGVPFLYEHPTGVYDRGRHRIWHPDFTLPTMDQLIVEYAGMPDRTEYMRGIRHKARVFSDNDRRALFVYPQDLRGPSWPDRLIQRIYDAPSSYRRSTFPTYRQRR